MKRKTLYTVFIAALSAALYFNYAGGPAAGGAGDVTKSPLSSGNCTECHSGGNFAPTISAQLLKNGSPITQYEPGEDYTFRLTITPSNGTPSRYGFQAVALRGETNLNAGMWDSPPAGTHVTTLNSRQYFEHGTPRTTNTVEIKWEAPAVGSGPVRFYASGNATNGNGSSDGDAAASLTNPLVIAEKATSAAFEVALLPAEITAYPNPVEEQLHLRIQIQESGSYLLSIYDLSGKQIQQKTIQLLNGENQETLNVNGLATGHYAVRLSDGKRIATKQIVKR